LNPTSREEKTPGEPHRFEITIVHELLHVALKEMERAVDALIGQVSSSVWTVVSTQYSGAEERVVDLLARVLVEERHARGDG
jgi:hypothetical protein